MTAGRQQGGLAAEEAEGRASVATGGGGEGAIRALFPPATATRAHGPRTRRHPPSVRGRTARRRTRPVTPT